MASQYHKYLQQKIIDIGGVEIDDADEETFLLFSHQIPSQNLGFVDSKATSIQVEIGKRSLTITQSPGLLRSNNDTGTTGAVLWKVTPLVASWLSSTSNILWKTKLLTNTSIVVELGCGVSGVIGLNLAPLISRYLLTDQPYVMKLLRENVSSNHLSSKPGRSQKKSITSTSSENLCLMSLDWETDSVANLVPTVGKDKSIDMVIACDCIYNDFLIKPFVRICSEICALKTDSQFPTILLIAQQLRSDIVFEAWLKETMKFFHVLRLPDDELSEGLQTGSGYVVHLSILKEAT